MATDLGAPAARRRRSRPSSRGWAPRRSSSAGSEPGLRRPRPEADAAAELLADGHPIYQLPAGFWSQLHCLLTSTQEPLTVGLNMRTGNLAWATQMAAEARSAARQRADFSFGNEPDLYDLPNYAALDKPLAGEEATDVGRYLQVAQSPQASLAGSEAVIGPELAVASRWRQRCRIVVQALGLGTVGVHIYPLSACRTPRRSHDLRAAVEPSVGNAPERLSWVAIAAHAVGLPAIISEANSVSCGGQGRASRQSPASAVWAAALRALGPGRRASTRCASTSAATPMTRSCSSGGQVSARPLERTRWWRSTRGCPSVPPFGASACAVRRPSWAACSRLPRER